MNVDPFELLGVSRAATEAEISAAYLRLAEVFNPERWQDAAPEICIDAIRWHEAIDQAVVVVRRPRRLDRVVGVVLRLALPGRVPPVLTS